MPVAKADIIAQLQREILPLEGFRHSRYSHEGDWLPGPVKAAFPYGCFPTGAVHELLSLSAQHLAATCGFIGGLAGQLMTRGGACVWISASRRLFPPALKAFGVPPERMIFVDLKREKDGLWAMEEALKCEGLAAVVGEIRDIGFTASRRLQLAVEQSRVTGFLLRHQPRDGNAIACIARWQISPVASEPEAGMPGVGFPRWKVELLKVRNGRPGAWLIEWSAGGFRLVPPQAPAILPQPVRKTG